jgi:hypothetical protein
MAIGKVSDFKIYQEEFFGGMTEKLQQSAQGLAEASRGSIVIRAHEHRGDYEKESFVKSLSGLVTRQDTTSVAAVTDQALTQDDEIRVKVHRKIGPVAQAKKAFKMISEDPQTLSFILGQQQAQAVAEDMLNTGLSAAVAALANQSAVKNDITSATVKTITHTNMLQTLAKFGDAADRIVAFVMHSTQFFDLGVQSIADQIESVASSVITAFKVQGFNKPFLVTDSASLIVTGDTPDSYYVLGLAQDGLQLLQSEDMDIVSNETITGLEQLVLRYQGEYAYSIGVKGFQWDTTAGGANPEAATVATGSNWDKVRTSTKDLAGVILKCQAQADQ